MAAESLVLLVNGPNLNRLGERDPQTYGTETLLDIVSRVRTVVEKSGYRLLDMQSNHEGAIIDFLQEHAPQAKGIILNPGAFAHYSYALRDCIGDVGKNCVVVEVHISNVYQREEFRHHSVIASVVNGQITGLGSVGYDLAAEYLMRTIPKA